jgi:putative transposase
MARRFDPSRHHRRSIRLPGYDYRSAGAYFVTICTHQRELLFEDPVLRRVAEALWQRIPRHFPHVQLDAWVVMPNHVHGILVIAGDTTRGEASQENVPSTDPMVSSGTESAGQLIAGDASPLRQRGAGSSPENVSSMDVIAPGEADLAEQAVVGDTSRGEASAENVPSMDPLASDGTVSAEQGVTGDASPLLPHRRAGSSPENVSSMDVIAPGETDSAEQSIAGDASPLRERPTGLAPGSLGAIVGNFKSVTARRINRVRGTPGAPVWQRNYYEHVVRDERALNAIRQYIADNPARWAWDTYNPAAAGPDPQAAELWRLLQEPIR